VKIKNINKRLITLALTSTLVLTPGCKRAIDDVVYATDEHGYISSIDQKLSYDFLTKCRFCKVKNKITEEEYYTVGIHVSNYRMPEGYDVFTRQDFFKGDFELEIFDKLESWLINLNMVKSEYTEEELRALLNIFIEKQEEKDKQLVKE